MSDETTDLAAEVQVTAAKYWFVKDSDRMSNRERVGCVLIAETKTQRLRADKVFFFFHIYSQISGGL